MLFVFLFLFSFSLDKNKTLIGIFQSRKKSLFSAAPPPKSRGFCQAELFSQACSSCGGHVGLLELALAWLFGGFTPCKAPHAAVTSVALPAGGVEPALPLLLLQKSLFWTRSTNSQEWLLGWGVRCWPLLLMLSRPHRPTCMGPAIPVPPWRSLWQASPWLQDPLCQRGSFTTSALTTLSRVEVALHSHTQIYPFLFFFFPPSPCNPSLTTAPPSCSLSPVTD